MGARGGGSVGGVEPSCLFADIGVLSGGFALWAGSREPTENDDLSTRSDRVDGFGAGRAGGVACSGHWSA